MEKMSVERSIWIEAPRERVWRAVTESEQISQWWGGDYWEITALPDDIRQQRFDSTAQGYETVLAGLKVYVERTNP